MNVTIKQLRAVVSLADEGTFRGAAEANHVTPPAMSIAIAELERELGVTLFDRTSRRVGPTTAGARFVESARRILGDIDVLLLDIGDVAAARTGTVTIASVASIGSRVLPKVFRMLARSNPAVEVRLIDDVGNKVVAAVRERAADFGLLTEPEALEGDLSCEPLHDDPFHVAFPKTHRFARKRRVAWSDLENEVLIGMTDMTASSGIVDRELRRQSIRLACTVRVAQLSVAHGMLDAGLGVCVLPEIALPPRAQTSVGAARLHRPTAVRSIVACRLRHRSLSPAAAIALEVVRQALRPSGDRQR